MANSISMSRINKMMFGILFLAMLFYAAVLDAQKPADFSGIWVQDTAKSDDFYKEFGITNAITQTPEKISFKETFYDKSGNELTTRESSFNLDGKEVSTEKEGGIDRDLATWSADNKSLIVKSTRTVGTDVYGSTSTYSLSADGRELNVRTSDINPMGPTVNQVFVRKK